ncbi:heparinase II/III domain-containing protein [Xylanibacter muris]|uniref:heparinase II/III domain-containing protein n=1 Tax=Xylanibacter muris TaxID=2736290 RepID=UPI00255828E4|nr:heparinase II/III family protein [Xylanibacter muris]
MKKTFVSFLLLSVSSSVAFAGTKLLTSLYDRTVTDSTLVYPGNFHPLPQAGDTFWRDSVPETIRNSYIAYGEKYLGKSWPALPVTEFARFKGDGNRTGYEQLSFNRRRQLAALVMAEITEGRKRFVPDIINGLHCILEETWWGIPAHYGKNIPTYEDQTVDLFNAETAGLIAWTAYMLNTDIESFSPQLRKRIDNEITRRILRPAAKTDYWWKRAGMNWNPWIASNWLACILICEHDRKQQTEGVAQIIAALDCFIDSYPADGGCDEGPNYWDRAAASLFDCLNLLNLATDGRIDVSDNQKIKAMAAYAYKLYVGKGRCVNFADANINTMALQLNVAYPFGLYIDDPVMKQFAAYIAHKKDFARHAAEIYDNSGNWPALARELFLIRNVNGLIKEEPREPLLKDVWLPDLQIMTSRSRNLFVAMKGGTNGESHNHNDVGSFIVYTDGSPLIVDPGVGSYTAKTFSKQRYDIWSMQSQYHNLPIINGTGQKDGRQYAASEAKYSKGRLSIDIAKAYPEEAGVRQWTRELKMNGKHGIEITETYLLDTMRTHPQIVLMCAMSPDTSVPGIIRLGKHRVEYDPSQLSLTSSGIDELLDEKLRGIWSDGLYRIVMTVKSEKTGGRIKYSIK